MSDWKKEALEMDATGEYSRREIARVLGQSKSTVSDFLRKTDKFGGLTVDKVWMDEHGDFPTEIVDLSGVFRTQTVKKGPRILIYDIETAPLRAHIWSMWQDGVGLNQIEQDWYIMSFAAKWLGEDEIFYYDQEHAEDMEDDSETLEKLWHLLNEADIVVGQNVKRFDTKKVNARLILNGYPKPSTYRQIDTMLIAKSQFGFTSNKLEYMTDKLCQTNKKSVHKKFPGHVLWSECLKGNPEAWAEMKEYNIDDILSTEELYNILSSWDDKLPNFDVYVDELLDMSVWEPNGYHYTNFGKFQRYRNKLTGAQRRSRVNLHPKEKRQQLLSNIV